MLQSVALRRKHFDFSVGHRQRRHIRRFQILALVARHQSDFPFCQTCRAHAFEPEFGAAFVAFAVGYYFVGEYIGGVVLQVGPVVAQIVDALRNGGFHGFLGHGFFQAGRAQL